MKTFRLLKDWITPWRTVKTGTVSRPYEFRDNKDPNWIYTHVEFQSIEGDYLEMHLEECMLKPDWFEEVPIETTILEKIASLEKRVEELEAEKNRIVDIQPNTRRGGHISDMPEKIIPDYLKGMTLPKKRLV